jgi:hypothetical protein
MFQHLTHKAPQHEQGNVSCEGRVVTQVERLVKVQKTAEKWESNSPSIASSEVRFLTITRIILCKHIKDDFNQSFDLSILLFQS